MAKAQLVVVAWVPSELKAGSADGQGSRAGVVDVLSPENGGGGIARALLRFEVQVTPAERSHIPGG